MIVALAKLTNAFMVGQFALGIAVSTPVLRLTNLQLRSVQASDARREYRFAEYFGLRAATTLIGFLAIVAIVAWKHDPHSTTAVILAVAAAKSVESVSDIFYGLFQVNDRLDQVGLSMMLKGVVSVATLGVALYLTRDVLYGVLALALGWLALLLFFDARRGRGFLGDERKGAAEGNKRAYWLELKPHYDLRRQFTLVRLALPLGIVTALISLHLHMPRYFVHFAMGEKELGVFSAMAYMTVGIVTVADALGYAATPRLSRLFAQRNLAAFRRLVLKLVASSTVLGVAGIGMAALAGNWILRIAYGAEYAGYGRVFLWLMAGGAGAAVASVLTSAMISTRYFSLQIPMFILVVGTNALACYWLVPSAGLTGGAVATLLATVVHVTLSACALLWVQSRVAQTVVAAEAASTDAEHPKHERHT